MMNVNNLVENGFEVFPVNGKKPLTEHGYLSASSEILQVWEWERKYKNCGWGFRLDQQQLIVIDVDNHGNNDGNQSIKANFTDEQRQFLSSCVYDKTPNNGYHFFLRLPDLFAKKLKATYQPFKSVEIKTVCINYYDNIRNGSLFDVPIAPDWALKLLKDKPVNNYSSSDFKARGHHKIASYWVKNLKDLMQGTEQGNRNVWLTSVCGTWINSGLSADEVFKLVQFANMNLTHPLDNKEILTIFNSIYRKDCK
ncbi:bifunctional DNA primase/polymerase [Fructilactobacillus sanfranciscensis]|uniref:bifunctional DNA primase/polymerase n=1 Tax=Fructilactobacillus sanfranciscensis TaxID=1625 RepID=UPI000CD45E19|nr:bifunctional DNA primase/polymerase [Fructilactobacillus sanfranciscensis]